MLPHVESVGGVDNEAVVEENADSSRGGVYFDGSIDEKALCELWKAVSIAISTIAVLYEAIELQMLDLKFEGAWATVEARCDPTKNFGIAGTHDCWNLAAIVNFKLLESVQTFALIFLD